MNKLCSSHNSQKSVVLLHKYCQQYLSLFSALSLVIVLCFFWFPHSVTASNQKVGIHILHPEEIDAADSVFATDHQSSQNLNLNTHSEDTWRYVTIPFTLNDLEKKQMWEVFFDKAQQKKIIPIVRLATEFQDGSWQIPTKKDIVNQIEFLNTFSWPTERKHLIIYNEVNHAKEWGATINPAEYARLLVFASNWAHTTDPSFFVLPAGLDLAAHHGGITVDAFWYLEQMHLAEPRIFDAIDGWNSHSYPNPGFTASPYRSTRNSLRGFEHELFFLEQKGKGNFPVYITETGWDSTHFSIPTLTQYYSYTIDTIWSHPQVVTATPFVLQGSPGPFSGFSFYDAEGKPTKQLLALQRALSKYQ